jgi:hypothetical protein
MGLFGLSFPLPNDKYASILAFIFNNIFVTTEII